jgi:adenosylmethionine-8-amino-7-oxononanoate aminotransferase
VRSPGSPIEAGAPSTRQSFLPAQGPVIADKRNQFDAEMVALEHNDAGCRPQQGRPAGLGGTRGLRGNPPLALAPDRRCYDRTVDQPADPTGRTGTTGRVFRRSLDPALPVAVEALGSTIRDASGREYLDAAGGAIVVNVGHGRASIARVLGEQAGRLSYAHGSAFTTEPLEAYAAEIGPYLPVDDPAIYPVSGGSEAIETALKMARAYHLARGETERWIVIARWGSYHGNSLGALDLSGRRPLRRPYEGWLGRFRHVSAAYPYRAGDPDSQALASADDLAAELDRAIAAAGPGTVAAFVAEPIVGATLAAAVPPDDYWPKIADVCRRHGVLLIADEVMTGFGRTGRWFGLDHWAVRADILVAAKGATSGYWPFGFAAASAPIHDTVMSRGGFVHGFTYSHAPAGAAVAREVLRILRDEDLVEASRAKGERLQSLLRERLARNEHVGDIRGRGLLVGLELVDDRETRRPFPRTARLTETLVRAARDRGVLVYSGTGTANGLDGDTILLGPPFVVTDDELVRIADVLTESVAAAVRTVESAAASG